MNFNPCLFHRNFYIFWKNSDTLYFSLCLSGQIPFNLIVNEDGKYPRATDYIAQTCRQQEAEKAELDKERRIQEAQLAIKQRFGKNAILRGLNFEEGATAKERNEQIGGHKA